MSNYPGTVDSYNVITAGRKMNESGYALSAFLNSHGSAVVNIENTLGTTAGTAMFTAYTASDKPLAHQSGTIQTDALHGTFKQIDGGGATNNLILYTTGTIDLQGKVGLQQGTSTTFYDFEGNEMVEWARDTSAVNYFKFTNSGTSEALNIEAVGDDTNVDLKLTPKGSGALSVADVTNYENNVTADDDIPNKKYVDDNSGGSVSNLMFRATMSGGQAVGGTYEKVDFDTETFDTNSDYDHATNYRFTPTVAGYYQINIGLDWSSVSDTNDIAGAIYKNGTYYSGLATKMSGSGGAGITSSDVVHCNGSSDYIEVFAADGGGSINGGAGCYFSGVLVGTV